MLLKQDIGTPLGADKGGREELVPQKLKEALIIDIEDVLVEERGGGITFVSC